MKVVLLTSLCCPNMSLNNASNALPDGRATALLLPPAVWFCTLSFFVLSDDDKCLLR